MPQAQRCGALNCQTRDVGARPWLALAQIKHGLEMLRTVRITLGSKCLQDQTLQHNVSLERCAPVQAGIILEKFSGLCDTGQTRWWQWSLLASGSMKFRWDLLLRFENVWSELRLMHGVFHGNYKQCESYEILNVKQAEGKSFDVSLCNWDPPYPETWGI